MTNPVGVIPGYHYAQSTENQKDVEDPLEEIQTILQKTKQTHEIFKKNLSSVAQHFKAFDLHFYEAFGAPIMLNTSQTTTEGQSAVLSSSEILKSREMESSQGHSQFIPQELTLSEVIVLEEISSPQEISPESLPSNSEMESQQNEIEEGKVPLDLNQSADLDEMSSDSETEILENELDEEDDISFAELGKELYEAAKKLCESVDALLASLNRVERCVQSFFE